MPPLRDGRDNGRILGLRLDCRPGNGERGLPFVGRNVRPDLLDASSGVGVRLRDGRSGHPNGGGVLK